MVVYRCGLGRKFFWVIEKRAAVVYEYGDRRPGGETHRVLTSVLVHQSFNRPRLSTCLPLFAQT